MLQQPPNIQPERLFRLLSSVPRPRLPVSLPFPGIARLGPFFVNGLTSAEIENAYDDSDDCHPSVRLGELQARLVALGLYADGGQAFISHDEVLGLDERTFAMLAGSVLPSLWDISPTFGRIDSDAWVKVLIEGAEHISNMNQALAMACCRDGWNGTPQPDRYYGLPQQQLTDGHWLCFRAAFKLAEKLR